MPILQGFALPFDPVESLARIRAAQGRPASSEALRQSDEQALAELQPRLAPAVAYGVYALRGRVAEGLLLANGQVLRSQVAGELFGAAGEVVIMVYTIGPAAEARAAELQAAGDYSVAYTLDALATLALNEVGVVACREIDCLAQSEGVRASIPLNPGTSHWPASDQPRVVALAGAGAIGVQVTSSFLLRPFKTNSMAIALGENVLTPEQGSSCDYCARPELCGRPRREAQGREGRARD
jgi:hypothetical protein